jgi:hypothetical protein
LEEEAWAFDRPARIEPDESELADNDTLVRREAREDSREGRDMVGGGETEKSGRCEDARESGDFSRWTSYAPSSNRGSTEAEEPAPARYLPPALPCAGALTEIAIHSTRRPSEIT